MNSIDKLFNNIKSKSFVFKGSLQTLQVHIKSVVPNVECIFKLTQDNSCHVEFSKDSWNLIIEKSQEIRNALKYNKAKRIFINSELKVFIEELGSEVCFLDIRGQKVRMTIKTFKNMMTESKNISSSYIQLFEDVKSTAESLVDFFNSLMMVHSQFCTESNLEYKNYLLSCQNQMKQLCSLSDPKDVTFDDNDYTERVHRDDCEQCWEDSRGGWGGYRRWGYHDECDHEDEDDIDGRESDFDDDEDGDENEEEDDEDTNEEEGNDGDAS